MFRFQENAGYIKLRKDLEIVEAEILELEKKIEDVNNDVKDAFNQFILIQEQTKNSAITVVMEINRMLFSDIEWVDLTAPLNDRERFKENITRQCHPEQPHMGLQTLLNAIEVLLNITDNNLRVKERVTTIDQQFSLIKDYKHPFKDIEKVNENIGIALSVLNKYPNISQKRSEMSTLIKDYSSKKHDFLSTYNKGQKLIESVKEKLTAAIQSRNSIKELLSMLESGQTQDNSLVKINDVRIEESSSSTANIPTAKILTFSAQSKLVMSKNCTLPVEFDQNQQTGEIKAKINIPSDVSCKLS